jgi:SAM-dependent methyltransferase
LARDAIFRIASLTKPITAVATMSLVEEGVLRLEDPIGELVPELADRRVLRAIDAELDDTVPAKRPITLEDLLSYRFGIGSVTAPPGSYPIQRAEAELGLQSIGGPPWPPVQPPRPPEPCQAWAQMNKAHKEFLASPDWARMLETDLLPWLERVADLGDDVLEVGPGPGLTTDLLRQRAAKVTAVELDDELATALRQRLAGTNVDVVRADATNTGLEANRFSAAACFSMLHHVPSADLQDAVFAEVSRVLRPSGMFLGVDSLDVDLIRQFHSDDVFVPVNPDTLGDRLEAVGFSDVSVEVGEFELRFKAIKTAIKND